MPGREVVTLPAWREDQYILQYGSISGMPYYYARSLERLGIPSKNVIGRKEDFEHLQRALPADRYLSGPEAGRLTSLFRKSAFLGHVLRRCPLVHFHAGPMLHHLDTAILKAFGRPMVITFAGGEARVVREASRLNPYFYRPIDDARDRRIRQFLRSLGRRIRVAATDPELAQYALDFFQHVVILRQPVDVSEIPCGAPSPESSCPRVLHLPTHPEVKGTEHVLRAFDRLKANGISFEPILQESNLTQAEARGMLSRADIVVDELRCGSHGMFSVEAMAAGKVVMTWIREDLRDKYPPDLPIVSVNPDTLYDRLAELLQDGSMRHRLGEASRAYAEKYHSLEAMGPTLIGIYRLAGLSDVYLPVRPPHDIQLEVVK